jgi:hypothetical protein
MKHPAKGRMSRNLNTWGVSGLEPTSVETNVITFGMRGVVWNAICFVTSDLYLKYNVYFIEIGENSVLYLKCNVCLSV